MASLPKMQIIQNAPRTTRKIRKPNHRFYVETKPYAITPFLLAPVTAGETMTSAMINARSYSMPIDSDLHGWHKHIWLFYVPMRAMPATVFDEFADMITTPTGDLSAIALGAADAKYYAEVGSVNWAKYCMESVVAHHFRHDDETWNTNNIFGYPALRVAQDNWTDSALTAAEYSGAVDIDVDLDADSTITASEVNNALIRWQQLVQQGLTTMDYNTFLKQFGVFQKAEEEHTPELLRYIRDFTYPTRYVDPATGVPVAHVQFNTQAKASTTRFFKEPGFVFGVMCFTPKFFSSTQTASAAGFLKEARHFLPAIAQGNPHIGMTEFAIGLGPIGASSAAYVFDVGDIFAHGDQFVVGTPQNVAALPSNDMTNKAYLSEAMVDAFFVGTASDAVKIIKTDGIAKLFVKSSMTDLTMTTT